MKWNLFFGALVVSVGLCGQSFGAGLLDRMLGLNSGGCCQPTCCETSCCAPEPACCEAPACCEPACCEAPACGGHGHHHGLLGGLFSGLHHRNACCQPACCQPACCEPVCCEAPVCEPACCPAPTCCAPRHHCGGLLAGLFGFLHHRNNCCQPSCCVSSCGGGIDSCCGGGGAPPAPGALGAPSDAAPMPPAPMPDPSASIHRKRTVVQTSGRVIRGR